MNSQNKYKVRINGKNLFCCLVTSNQNIDNSDLLLVFSKQHDKAYGPKDKDWQTRTQMKAIPKPEEI